MQILAGENAVTIRLSYEHARELVALLGRNFISQVLAPELIVLRNELALELKKGEAKGRPLKPKTRIEGDDV